MAIDLQLRKDLVAFLMDVPILNSENGRRAVLLNSGLDTIFPQIELKGTPYEFVSLLIDVLDRYGQLSDKQLALNHLLLEVMTQVGQDRREILRGFCDRITQLAAEPHFERPQYAHNDYKPPPKMFPDPVRFDEPQTKQDLLHKLHVTTQSSERKAASEQIPHITAPEPEPQPEKVMQPEPEPASRIISHTSRIQILAQSLAVAEDEAQAAFRIGQDRRPLEYVRNDYEDRGAVVIDHATGLMWQKSGSESRILQKKVQSYIHKLNAEGLAGYTDWRLPTVEELLSLLEPEIQSNKLHLNPIFDSRQKWCWSANICSEEAVWCVHFHRGYVHSGSIADSRMYVRAVRF